MLVAKMYAVAWLLVIASAWTSYMTGSFDSIRLTIFGFLVSTLFFMGIVSVLPAMMNDHYSAKVNLNRFENEPISSKSKEQS